MPAASDFKPSRKRPAAYFNDGKTTVWVQSERTDGTHDQALTAAIKAAEREFWRVFDAAKTANRKAADPRKLQPHAGSGHKDEEIKQKARYFPVRTDKQSG